MMEWGIVIDVRKEVILDEGKIRVRCQEDSKKYGSGVETKEE